MTDNRNAHRERTVAKVAYCVPARGGSLTWERVAAGWNIGLSCARGCEFRGYPSLPIGQKVSHVCDSASEQLPELPGELPDVIVTVEPN